MIQKYYHVWCSETSSEDKPEGYNNWHKYPDENPQEAANALAQRMVESGNFPDHEQCQKFLIHVREFSTGKLFLVTCGIEYTPYTFPKTIVRLT